MHTLFLTEDEQLAAHVIQHKHQKTCQNLHDIAIPAKGIHCDKYDYRFQQAGTNTASHKSRKLL